MASLVLFSLLAWSGKSELLFAIAVIFDDMAAAFGSSFVLSFRCWLIELILQLNMLY